MCTELVGVVDASEILDIVFQRKTPMSINIYTIIRVHSGFSLVKDCGLLEDRRTLTPFQRQVNHSNFRIIDSQWRALFCIVHDHVKWRAKAFSSYYKAYFSKIFHIFII